MPNQHAATFLLLTFLAACGEVARIGAGMDSDTGGNGATSEAGAGGDSMDGSSGAPVPRGGRAPANEPASGGTAGESVGLGGGTGSPAGGTSFGGTHTGSGAGTGGSSCSVNPNRIVSADEARLSSDALSDDECEAVDETLRDEWDATESRELDVELLAGTWIDESGSDRVELVLDETGNGSYLIGVEAEPATIDDPYEPFLISQAPNQIGVSIPAGPFQDFRYRVYPVAGLGSQMSFLLRLSQPWDEWCAMQVPIRGDRCYGCELILRGASGLADVGCGELAGCYTENDHEQWVRLHCGRFTLCASLDAVCECTSEECRGSLSESRTLTATRDPVDPNVLRLDDGSGSDTRYLVRTN
jgi:hypothetical protein